MNAPIMWFEGWSERIAEALGMQQFRQLDVPAVFSQRAGLGPLHTTRLYGMAWRSPALDLRSTYIAGPKVEIINLMGFPGRPDLLPIFATEIIMFAGTPRVAVLDLQPVWMANPHRAPLNGRLAEGLTRYAASFADLPPGGDLPDWCRDYFTPHAIYSRPGDASAMPRLHQAFEALAHHFREAWLEQPMDDAAAPGGVVTTAQARAAAEAEMATYKRHHIEHSPGLPYLNKVFGAEWTAQYLQEFMYA